MSTAVSTIEKPWVAPIIPAPPARTRLVSLDTWKVLAIIAMVAQHSSPFKVLIYKSEWAYYTSKLLFHFAVPFFLLTSGYLLGQSMQRGRTAQELCWRKAQRLLPAFLFWCVVYDLTGERQLWHLITHEPLTLMIYGTKAHLWFVSATLMAFAVVGALAVLGRLKWLIPVAIAAFLVGWAAKIWMVATGTSPLGFGPRDSALYSLLFVALGMRAAKRPLETWRVSRGLALIALGFGLIVTMMLVRRFALGDNGYSGFYFGELALGWGVLHLALARPAFGAGTILPRLGPITLGLYLAHIFVMDLLIPHRYSIPPVAWDLILDPLILALTVGLVLLMRRWRVTAPLVS